MDEHEIHTKVIDLYYDDRVGFVNDIIFGNNPKFRLDKPQLDILKDMDNGAKNIAAKSGHGVGKSALLSFSLLHFLMTRPECVITATAPSANQLSDVLWPEIQRWMNVMMRNPLGRVIAGQYKWTSENIYHKDYPDTWFASARTASKENPQALAGRHSKRNMNLIDEASDVDGKAIEIMESNYGTEETITMLMGKRASQKGLGITNN